MSLEDDTDNAEVELKELVTQTLEENGLLARIRAQLRAGLYLALETDINKREQQSKIHGSLKSKLSKPDIRTIFCLVHEFLEYFELKFTLNVFERETELGTIYSYENREKLIQDLDIGIDNNSPLLLEILNIARSSFNLSIRNESINKKDANNDTYDVPSEKDSYITDSETSQHVIEIKTVPKENSNDLKTKISNSSHSDRTETLNVTNSDRIETESFLSHVPSNSDSEVSQHIIDIKTVPKDFFVERKSNSSVSKSDRTEKCESGAVLKRITSNSTSEVSEHVIDIKTVPKEVLNDFKSKLNVSKPISIDSEPILSSPKFLNLTKISQLDEEQDDTYEGTSSIAEDSIIKDQPFLIDFDRSFKHSTNLTHVSTSGTVNATFGVQNATSGLINSTNLNVKTILDQTIVDESQKSPKFAHNSDIKKLSNSPTSAILNSNSTNLNAKTIIDNDESPKSPRLSFSPDSKKHEKSDRKPMSGLTSLADLPPLQINKNRNTDTVLLPSLYSKDFRDKNSLKDIDKLSELGDNYEDDFLSTSSIENDDKSSRSESNSLDLEDKTKSRSKSGHNELNISNSSDKSTISQAKIDKHRKEFNVSNSSDESVKSRLKSDARNLNKDKFDKENNDVITSSISEDLNSNIDILKSTSA